MSKAVVVAGILGIIGVMIGAYAAHGLEAYLQKQSFGAADIAKRLDQCDVAVRYHMLHTLAILALGLSSATHRSRLGAAAIVFWFLGILLFCGGLYSIVFLGKMGHWAIVPSGGLCFMLGWALLVLVGATLKRSSASSGR
jgi:uncharacterized membrane protein YgdD (TMEM256/DUF423 family)